jgi:hypothetical protein
MEITCDSGVLTDSVVVHYGTEGQYGAPLPMERDSTLGENVYAAMIPAIGGPTDVFVNYYVSAKNHLGVWGNWPKSAPQDDHAAFWVGETFRAVYTDPISLPLRVPPGEIATCNLLVEAAGSVHDLNVHVSVEARKHVFPSYTLEHTDADSTVVWEYLLGYENENPHASWPLRFDVWFDDELDASYQHFRPYRYQWHPGVDPLPSLTAFNSRSASGEWTLVVDNTVAGSDTVVIRDYEIQIATSMPAALLGSRDAAPDAPRLGSPYPNPGDRATVVPFYLASGGRVRLKVYDVAGRLVRVLLDERLSRGQHEVRWDGRGEDGRPVGSGVYFYRLRAGGATMVQKTVILR